MTVVPLTSMPAASALTGAEIFYLQQSAADAKATITQVMAVAGAAITTVQSNATGTSSASAVHMGFGTSSWGTPAVITPTFKGSVVFGIYGNLLNAGAFATSLNLRYGTGSAPTNGTAGTGTTLGSTIIGLGNLGPPFSAFAPVTGLSPGTAYWFDVCISVGGSSGSVTNVTMVAWEL